MEQVKSKSNTNKKKENPKNIIFKSKYGNIHEGQIFHDWTYLELSKPRGNSSMIKCKCKCGLENSIYSYDLIKNRSKRCRSCSSSLRNIKHGQNQHGKITYEYVLWQRLKFENKLRMDWAASFDVFFNDIGKKPVEGYVLLRKNTSQPYSISNCFWGHRREKYFKDIQGKKFGSWTVLEKDFVKTPISWICQCVCGRKDHVHQDSLLNGHSYRCKSCAGPKHTIKHGKSKTKEYSTYYGMKRRCLRENEKAYKHYGGRGIKVCDRWLESFENFLEDMGERPQGMSLDRIDPNGNYEPSNCRWSNQKTQCQNRRKIDDLEKEIVRLKMVITDLEISLKKYNLE